MNQPAAKAGKPPRQYEIRGQVYTAHTKSEARAQAKRKLGLARLPAGEAIREVR